MEAGATLGCVGGLNPRFVFIKLSEPPAATFCNGGEGGPFFSKLRSSSGWERGLGEARRGREGRKRDRL